MTTGAAVMTPVEKRETAPATSALTLRHVRRPLWRDGSWLRAFHAYVARKLRNHRAYCADPLDALTLALCDHFEGLLARHYGKTVLFILRELTIAASQWVKPGEFQPALRALRTAYRAIEKAVTEKVYHALLFLLLTLFLEVALLN